MNKVYKALLHSKIEKFIYDLQFSKRIFEDIGKKNKLLHPAEYGSYKEKICDDMIKFYIPNKFRTGTGFLINSDNKTSTQCDVLIYDYNHTPLIEDIPNTTFFPVETVASIGEIKSTLTVRDLSTALIKLATNKKIKQLNQKNIFCINNSNQVFNPAINPYDTIFSFLICDKIESFDKQNIFQKIDAAYTAENIEYEYRHNVILSIQDGVLTYNNQFDKLSKEIPQSQKMSIPKFMKYKFENLHVNDGYIEDTIYVFSSLSNFLMNVNIYYPEPNSYTK